MHISREPAAPVAVPSRWFSGDARVESVVELESVSEVETKTHVDSVQFAPGARTVWHRHPLGQILRVTEGTGRVQRRGGSVETITVGDTVRIEPGEWHWHGAAPDTSMTHLAIEQTAADGTAPEAGAPVTDREYHGDAGSGGGSGGESDSDSAGGESTEEAPPITRVILLDQPLTPPRTTQHVEIRRITIAPNFAAGLHVHNGPVFGSIETGSAVYQIEGEPPSVLGPGDVFYEPEGARIARFDAQSDGVTFLGYFLLAAGEAAAMEFPDA